MIRLTDPARLGPALAEIRALYGYTRADLARLIAANTGRTFGGVYQQLGDWDLGINNPSTRAIGPLLDVLGYDLALVPKEDA